MKADDVVFLIPGGKWHTAFGCSGQPHRIEPVTVEEALGIGAEACNNCRAMAEFKSMERIC